MSKLPSFEDMVKMHKEDPEGLELLRKQAVKEIIDNAPENSKRRLEGLQFQIDCIRRTSKNPVDAMIKVSNMMKESFEDLRKNLNALTGKEPLPDLNPKNNEVESNVIHFKGKENDK